MLVIYSISKVGLDAKATKEAGDLNDMEFLLRAKRVKAKVHVYFTVPLSLLLVLTPSCASKLCQTLSFMPFLDSLWPLNRCGHCLLNPLMALAEPKMLFYN